MLYRELGQTGVQVSVIGFGASPLGNVFGEVTAESAGRAVSRAIDEGVNLFDVSPYYGATLAEERLGAALSGKRSQILLGTKCGRYGADRFDFSADTITREFDRSLQRLQTDYVDLLQAHDIEFGDAGQVIHETLPAMRRLQQAGKVRFIGITGYWPGFLARIAETAEVDCVLNYCHDNLFVDDMRNSLLPVARRKGLGLLNASPLHMGLLAGKPVPAWHPAPAPVQQAAAQVLEACAHYDVSAATLALSWCLTNDTVASTFVGISSEHEVMDACAALQAKIPAKLQEEVERIVKPVHNIVWPSGREENQDSPRTDSEPVNASH